MKVKKIIRITPLLALLACGPSASEIEAKVKSEIKREQDSIAKADLLMNADAELTLSKRMVEDVKGLEWNYSGTIDKYKIKAQINYGEGTNSEGTGALEIPITGYYFYESQNQKMQLEGSSNGAGVVYLIAHTSGGDETFDGQFTGSMLEDFSGTWAKNGKALGFKLNSKK